MSHSVDSLDPTAFQQLMAALAARALGAQVQSFGKGPDGGRDFTFHGPLRWTSAKQPTKLWDGYTVFQVKRKDELSRTGTANAAWLTGQIKEELDDWTRPGTQRGEMPNYLVFISNVPLTASPKSGGFDRVTSLVNDHLANLRSADEEEVAHRAKCIRDWRIWDRNQINTYLDAYSEVRSSFRSLLTAEDVLRYLRDTSPTLPSGQLEEALHADVAKRLLDDRYVYFAEAGADVDEIGRAHV